MTINCKDLKIGDTLKARDGTYLPEFCIIRDIRMPSPGFEQGSVLIKLLGGQSQWIGLERFVSHITNSDCPVRRSP